MLRTSTLLTAIYALQVATRTTAESTIAVWLPAPDKPEKGAPDNAPPPFTLTVGQEDYTFPDTNAVDYKEDGVYVRDKPVGGNSFALAGYLRFDDDTPKPVQFWIRAGGKDTPTREMTKCWATFTEDSRLEPGSEVKLFLDRYGEISMWEWAVLDYDWLTCTDTGLIDMPRPGTDYRR